MAEGVPNLAPDQGTISLSPVNPAIAYHIPVLLHGHVCSFLLDTGAAVSLLSSPLWNKYHNDSQQLTPTMHWLVGVTGDPLTVQGSATLPLLIGENKFDIPVIIVDNLKPGFPYGYDCRAIVVQQPHDFMETLTATVLQHSGCRATLLQR